MLLIWQAVKRMRNDGFFDAALGRPHQFPPDLATLTEVDFIRTLKVSGIHKVVESPYQSPPRLAYRDVPLLFDLIEFLYAEATPEPKRSEFRERLRSDLAMYTPPMEMLDSGQIVEKVPDELDPLVSEPVADDLPAEFADPLTHAIEQFRRRGASEQDKRSALRQLAGVLEPLREDIKKHALSADESAIFQIANKFGIRHTNREQQRDYDPVWLDWMFYVYVATVRALMAVLSREELERRVAPVATDDLPF
jgi:hypothetical protein